MRADGHSIYGLNLSPNDKLSRNVKNASIGKATVLDAAADAWTVAVWTLGLDGRVTYANREARAALGGRVQHGRLPDRGILDIARQFVVRRQV